MNLTQLDTLRRALEDTYYQLLLDQWLLDIRPRAMHNVARRTIEIRCYHSTLGSGEARTPLGEPLVYSIAEAASRSPAGIGRMLDHVRVTANLSKLLG
jgi:hypothetical protein